jgi:hypothetical protein
MVNVPITTLVQDDVIPVVRAMLREATELRAAVQVLTERIEALTIELAEGELSELRRLAGAMLRILATHNGGGKP